MFDETPRMMKAFRPSRICPIASPQGFRRYVSQLQLRWKLLPPGDRSGQPSTRRCKHRDQCRSLGGQIAVPVGCLPASSEYNRRNAARAGRTQSNLRSAPRAVHNIPRCSSICGPQKIATLSRAIEHRITCRKKLGLNIPADWALQGSEPAGAGGKCFQHPRFGVR